MHQMNPKLVEENLEKLFSKYGIAERLSVDDVKKFIFTSRGKGMDDVNRYHKKVLSFFNMKELSIDQMNEILQVFTDAWNYFPHKALGGKSPNDIVALYKKDEQKKGIATHADSDTMPDMIVGGRKMKWDDYWSMIKEMERIQEPFKEWIREECLPLYERHLEQTYKSKAIDTHHAIADYFFLRALKLGFVDLESIHRRYVQEDYPQWFQTHVLDMHVTPTSIRKSLLLLFNFLSLAYNVDKKKYGF